MTAWAGLRRAVSRLGDGLRWLERQVGILLRGRRPAVGFGAVPIPLVGGFAFRVWAPTARTVEVTGEFAADADGTGRPGGTRCAADPTATGPASSPRRRSTSATSSSWPRPTGECCGAWTRLPATPSFRARRGQREHPRRFDVFLAAVHEARPVGVRHLPAARGHVHGTQRLPARGRHVRGRHGRLAYIRDLGFTAIELTPVQEFTGDRSWGYNPSFYFAPESAYGSPHDLRALVDEAHALGLAVLFDVVYNHVSNTDNPLWELDGDARDGGVYLQRFRTPWSEYAPAYWKPQVRDFFLDNARMYLTEYTRMACDSMRRATSSTRPG